MASAIAFTAFILPSGPEMIVILVVGIMLFGRRLPEVGRKVGQTVVQLRQGFHKLKADMDLETDVREVRDTFRDTRRELTESAGVPRGLGDPRKLLKDLTDETLAATGPTEESEAVPESLFER